MQVRVVLHQVPDPLPIVPVHAQYHHLPHAQGTAFGQQGRAIRVKVRKVQVGVGVDQLHASILKKRQPWWIRCLNVRAMACTPGW
jgi:hypothetical protein